MAGEMDRKRPVENIGVMEDEPPVKIAKLNLAAGPENMMTALIASQFYPQKGAEPNRMGKWLAAISYFKNKNKNFNLHFAINRTFAQVSRDPFLKVTCRSTWTTIF